MKIITNKRKEYVLESVVPEEHDIAEFCYMYMICEHKHKCHLELEQYLKPYAVK